MRFVQGKLGREAWWLLPCALVCLAAYLWPMALRAQPTPATPETATKAPTEATPEESDKPVAQQKDSIAQLMRKSGPVGMTFYGILFLFSVISLTVGLERIFNLRRGKILPNKFKKSLSDILLHHSGRTDELRRLCETSDTPVSRILRAGVLRAGRPLTEVEKVMEDAAASEMADLRGRNRLLYVLGNVGPLIGLLGTVIGMVITFNTAAAKGLGKGEDLAEGIYLALLCTAGGLTIAIPSLLVAAMLNSRAERLMREVVDCVNETVPLFMRMEKDKPAAAASFFEDDSNGKTLVDFTVPRKEKSEL